jgi:SAM-dependent methyltransferase
VDNWLFRVADNRNPASLAGRLRQRRMQWLADLLRGLPRPVTILDVGGTELFWKNVGLAGDQDYRITLHNRRPQPVTLANLTSITGDARDLGAYPDGAFDVVFSNSVIEHVGGPADQRAMADEVRRVGRAFFVQTPNRWFPIEPHFLFPLFQFLPRSLRILLVRSFALGWYPRAHTRAEAEARVDEIRLLGEGELRSMFPDAAIRKEKVLLLTKSLVALRGLGRA